MFELKIDTSNKAFSEENGGPSVELAAILKDLAYKVVNGATEGPLRDTNGNAVGSYQLTATE